MANMAQTYPSQTKNNTEDSSLSGHLPGHFVQVDVQVEEVQNTIAK